VIGPKHTALGVAQSFFQDDISGSATKTARFLMASELSKLFLDYRTIELVFRTNQVFFSFLRRLCLPIVGALSSVLVCDNNHRGFMGFLGF
jgi:hypothetical protein